MTSNFFKFLNLYLIEVCYAQYHQLSKGLHNTSFWTMMKMCVHLVQVTDNDVV